MFVNDCLNINEKGHLTIGGCDTVELAKEYGTPLYVLDENTIRTTCRSYVESFKKFYNGNGMPLALNRSRTYHGNGTPCNPLNPRNQL